MKSQDIMWRARKFAAPFRITNGDKFRLKDFHPDDTLGLKSEDKPRAKEALAIGVKVLAELQDKGDRQAGQPRPRLSETGQGKAEGTRRRETLVAGQK